MEKKKKVVPKDNESNQKNRNKGTIGTNEQYDKVQKNRDKQLKQDKIKKEK